MRDEELVQLHNEALAEQALKRAARRGRPPLPAGEGKRHPLGIRTTKQLREQLEQAAKSSGRSLAQEVEYRLEKSFDQSQMTEVFLNAENTLKEHIENAHNELRGKLNRDVVLLLDALDDILRAVQERARTAARDPRVRAKPLLEKKR